MSSMSDGLNMQPRVKEPDSPFVVPGMGVPVSPPADIVTRAREGIVQPFSIQFPPLIPDTSTAFPQPPGAFGQEPASWQYDFTSLDGVTGISRATYPGEVDFQSSSSVPSVPVTIAQGGTNRTNWVTNGFVTYSSTPTPQMTPLGGNGVAIVSLNTPSIATTLPINLGGTGTGTLNAGAVSSTGGASLITQACAFSAYNTVQPSNVTGAGQQANIICDTVDFANPATCYSASTGIFTAPIAGKYLVRFQATFGPMASTHTWSDSTLTVSDGRIYWGRFIHPYNSQAATNFPSNGACQGECTAIISLTAGQTVTPSFAVNGTGSPTTIGLIGNTANRPTRFEAFLIAGM